MEIHYILIKTLVYYEKINLIEEIHDKLITKNDQKADFIYEAINYSLQIDQLKLTFYLLKKYSLAAISHKERIIDALTNSLLSYTDVDIREKSCGIMYLEEKLHVASIFINHFDTKRALNFLKTLNLLLNFHPDGEESAPYGNLQDERNPYKDSERELDQGVVIHKTEVKHHTKDNFLVHSPNPLKIVILILTLVKKFENLTNDV